MPIAAFFIILAGAVAIAILYPHLRVLALAVVALFGSLAAYLAFNAYGSPGAPVGSLTAEELVLKEVVFVQDARFDRLQGRVTNTSDKYRLRDFDILVRLLDCPAPDSAPDNCDVIGTEGGTARADVPPGQTRTFDLVLGYTQSPTLAGVLAWDYEITRLRSSD